MAELGPFTVGAVPSWPLQITVLDPEGTPRDLTGAAVEVILFDPLGVEVAGGVTIVLDSEAGRVQYTWPPDGFEAVGEHLARTVITDNGNVDYASDVSINVFPYQGAYTDLRVTPTEVERYTRVSIGNPEIDLGQFDVSLAVGRNVHDDIFWDSVSAADQQWLKLAIAHQAASKDTSTVSPLATTAVSGAKSVRSGDLQITYTDGANSGAAGILAPMAALAVARLSWVGSGTIHATPFLGHVVPALNPAHTDEWYPWVEVSTAPRWLRGA